MRYTIQQGDTLSSIAQDHNTTAEEIMKDNNITDPNKIYRGNDLILQSPTVQLQLVDALMKPIEGLEIILNYGNQEMCHTTDAQGHLPIITITTPHEPMQVKVKKVSGGYKPLGTVKSGNNPKKIVIQSPYVVFSTDMLPKTSDDSHTTRPIVSKNQTINTTQTQKTTHYAIASNHAPWVDIALREEGILENKNKNLMEPKINKYYQAANYKPGWKIDDDNDKDAWCGCFVAWVMKQAGYQPAANAANSQSWKNFGRAIKQPIFGAIAVRKKVGNNGHVAIVIGQSKDGKRIIVIGGNQSDAVNRRSFPKADKKNHWIYRVPTNYDTTYATLPIDYKGTIEGGKTR